MILVGHQTPDFETSIVTKDNTIKKNINFYEHIKGNPALLFFYPLDFTFVCPSELLMLDRSMDEFNKRNIKVISMSVDSEFTHLAWKKTPVEKGGIGSLRFDMGSDVSHQIAQMYGVEHFDHKIALRAAFIIDKKGIVRSQIVNDLPLGRNIEEILRMFDALDHVEKNGEVCPANWQKGQKAIIASSEGINTYLSETFV
jgi:peroxiredoxin (alkyl hydroperoxide reductase subunit C)